MDSKQFSAWLKLNYRVGQKLPLTILRNGQRVKSPCCWSSNHELSGRVRSEAQVNHMPADPENPFAVESTTNHSRPGSCSAGASA